MAILLDTGFIYAIYNKKDKYHSIVRKIKNNIVKGKYGRVLLLDYVFDELMTLIQSRTKSNKIASDIGNDIKREIELYIKLIHVNNSNFEDAWVIFRNQKDEKHFQKTDKLLSFTDCIIISISKTLGISLVASLDQRFRSWVSIVPDLS